MSEHISNEEKELVAQSLEMGAMEDKVDVKNLSKWTAIVIVIVLGLILIGSNLYSFYTFKTAEETAIRTEYKDLKNYKQNVDYRLNNHGIVDDEKKIYHIPVEKAIDIVVKDYQN